MKSATVVQMRKLGVLDQVQQSIKPANRLAFGIGFALGGFIPTASYTVCHLECPQYPALWVLVVAGLCYSALTVFDWARTAFKHPAKAVGFVVLLEGVIMFSHTESLSLAALAVLITINGVATAANLIADRRMSRSR